MKVRSFDHRLPVVALGRGEDAERRRDHLQRVGDLPDPLQCLLGGNSRDLFRQLLERRGTYARLHEVQFAGAKGGNP